MKFELELVKYSNLHQFKFHPNRLTGKPSNTSVIFDWFWVHVNWFKKYFYIFVKDSCDGSGLSTSESSKGSHPFLKNTSGGILFLFIQSIMKIMNFSHFFVYCDMLKVHLNLTLTNVVLSPNMKCTYLWVYMKVI